MKDVIKFSILVLGVFFTLETVLKIADKRK